MSPREAAATLRRFASFSSPQKNETPPVRLLASLLAFAIAIPAGVRAGAAAAPAAASAPGQPIKITHGPYLQNVGEDGATIVWLTNKKAVSWVELAPDDGAPFYHAERPRFYAAKIGIKTEGTIHTVTLKELKPGVKHRYRVYSQEVLKHEGWHVHYGDIAASDVYRRKPLGFTTNDRNKPEITFSVVNDIHGDNAMLGQLLGRAEPGKNDFVIFNGDMISTVNSEDDIFNGFMDKSVELFASETPMYYARGNHETRGSHASRFQEYFTPARPALYYMFRHGPVCFI